MNVGVNNNSDNTQISKNTNLYKAIFKTNNYRSNNLKTANYIELKKIRYNQSIRSLKPRTTTGSFMIRKVVSPLSWEGSVLDVPYTSSYLLVPVKWFRLVYFRSTYLKSLRWPPPCQRTVGACKSFRGFFFSEKKNVKKTHPSWLPLFVMLVEGGSRDAPQTFTLGPATFTLVLAWGCSHFQGRMACRAFF